MDKPFHRLRRISYHLTWAERFVCITSGLSLTCAILIAGFDMSYVGRTLPLLGALSFCWVVATVLAMDTQLVAATSAFRDSLGRGSGSAAAGWLFVMVVLIPPAALVNIAFGLVTSGLASTDVAAVHMLGITPFLWVAQRGFYGIFLLIVSVMTRPWAERKIDEAAPLLVPVVSVKRQPIRTRPAAPSVHNSTKGRRKRAETTMTLWREAEALRLYRQNSSISARALAAQLTYTAPETGTSYPCATETAARILRPLRASQSATGPTTETLEQLAA